MENKFTWIPLYTEMANLLVDWEDRQDELVAFLAKLRDDGVKVTKLIDKDSDGNRFLLKEIDPFTFYGTFNRGVRDKERVAALTEIKKLLGATSPLPQDFDGIPILNNQQSWFISYQSKRGRDDVKKLWEMFRLAQRENPFENSEFLKTFNDCLQIRGVSVNLTMGLFWIRPDVFLNLDNVNRSYLDIKLPPEGLNADFFAETTKSVSSGGKKLSVVSHEAWLASKKTEQKKRPTVEKGNNYWLVGAYWDELEPADQTDRFLADGNWVNGFTDKLLDEVKSMKVGDRIGIKASGTQKKNLPFDARGHTVSRNTIKAVGTIVANRGDGRTVEVEWVPNFEPKEWYFYTMRGTVWRLRTDSKYKLLKYSNKLIDFVWNDAEQDYEWFCNDWYGDDQTEPETGGEESGTSDYDPYGVDDVVTSGVFLDPTEIELALDRLTKKKNLIIQGAPGVGKTFVARKLAFALMEEKATDRLEMVQFHQTYSYEDFIRGYRPLPEKDGAFGLKDAVFYEFCKRAQEDPSEDYVFIIDEINRGNLSQIFGELLMLIEADKRGPEFSVPLVYQKPGESRFYVPPNVYLIGLMNLADRSLALVDYALRRRFAFLTLEAQYSSPIYREWLIDRDMSEELVNLVVERISQLNDEIAQDPLLGDNYQVGHSFFCPKGDDFSRLGRSWYEGVVQTEILPLLKEYWFDNAKRVEQAKESLLAQ